MAGRVSIDTVTDELVFLVDAKNPTSAYSKNTRSAQFTAANSEFLNVHRVILIRLVQIHFLLVVG